GTGDREQVAASRDITSHQSPVTCHLSPVRCHLFAVTCLHLFSYDTPMQEFEAERGRWLLGGCIAVFALPFFIAGVNLLTLGIRGDRRGDSGALVLLAIGIGLTALSVSFVALIWFGLRQMQAASRRRNLNPMQPWLWRDDWAAHRVAEGTPRIR